MIKNNNLDDASNEPPKFRIKNWFETNYDARGTCGTSCQIRYKDTRLMPALCDYSDVIEI